MYGRESLAQTGATITLLGASVAYEWVLAVIVAMVLGGAALYRWANRGNRHEPH
ncbi:hypothetical protein GCM10009759_14770 [Kitasatospora saccharophila]|uniref:LPXTG-motif cell wall-anchored protein n=1 Tax=Kitasatospora saccharophila TaxID=407973 RepID=A0ABP5I3M3_9ACTN